MTSSIRTSALRLAALSAGLAALGGCASTMTLFPPVTPGMTSSSGKSQAMLQQGRQIYAGPCTSCHVAAPLTKFTPTEWVGIMKDMSERANLSPAQHEAVLAYVLAARPTVTAAR